MKKIKTFERFMPGKFVKGQWIVPLIDNFIPIRAYQIIEAYSSELNMQIGSSNEWSYQIRGDENRRHEFKESQIRKATKEEIEFALAIQSYNL